MLRKWKKLGLANIPSDILWMCMSLALLPARHFEDGLTIIQRYADAIGPQNMRIHEFMAYMRNQWLPRAGIVCVYRCPRRTNNEAMNRQLQCRIGNKQNFYKFLGSKLKFLCQCLPK